jgi:hypothetical protein
MQQVRIIIEKESVTYIFYRNDEARGTSNYES